MMGEDEKKEIFPAKWEVHSNNRRSSSPSQELTTITK
jgi:hypothetical protein